MTTTPITRYVFTFELYELEPQHEVWLFEWSLYWLDYDLRRLTVARSDCGDATHVRIEIDIVTETDARTIAPHVARLATRVEDLDIDVTDEIS